jgi:PTH1 family peptidyl-tRNA hydrolase
VRLVVGLGNPGKQYERTRHNVGWMVVDRCCERRGIEPAKKSFEARYAFHGVGREQVAFVKPLTYMNLSGEAVRAFADFYKVAPEEILVVCDDMALPLGQLRIRAGGSSGGQKGLESTIRMLGTDRFPRLRVGIGAPPPYMDAADWVLGKLAGDEAKTIAEAVEKAADAVDCWLREGVEKAQQRFNAREKKEMDAGADRPEGARDRKEAREPGGSRRRRDAAADDGGAGDRASGRASPRLEGGPEKKGDS